MGLVPQVSFPTPGEFDVLRRLGEMAVKSGFLPQSINTPDKAVIIMLKGKELGIPPMQAFSSIAVVNGKPTMSAELMLALIYKNVPSAEIVFQETTDKACVVVAKRKAGMGSTFSFTIEDAKRADLLRKGPWVQYPAAMLRARCISAMARAMFPDAIMGVSYTPEEMGAEVNEEGIIVELDRPNPISIESREEEVRNEVPTTESPPTLSPPKSEAQERILKAMAVNSWLATQVVELMELRFKKKKASELLKEEVDKIVQILETQKYDSAIKIAQAITQVPETLDEEGDVK